MPTGTLVVCLVKCDICYCIICFVQNLCCLVNYSFICRVSLLHIYCNLPIELPTFKVNDSAMVDTAIGGMKFKATIYEVERPVSFLIVFLSQKVVKYPFL